MLPAETCEIVEASELIEGDFAFLLGHGEQVPVLICTPPGHPDAIAVCPTDGFVALYLPALNRHALRVRGARVELSHDGLDHIDSVPQRIGSFVLRHRGGESQLAIVSVPPDRHGDRIVKFRTVQGSTIENWPYAFQNWQIVVGEGAEKVVLFKRSDAQTA